MADHSPDDSGFAPFRTKMQEARLSEAAIVAFERNYRALCNSETGLIAESSIEPIADLPSTDSLADEQDLGSLLSQTVVIKLNGGLGTSMGLAKAKTLLPLKDGATFLDLIAKQILHLRETFQSPELRFLLMNSFATSADTLAFLSKYPELGTGADLELLQNRVPKITADTLEPLSFPAQPDLEWCPPGHGDLYAALVGSGWLDRLIDAGVLYAFVSNSDNLGATLDPPLLSYFADSGAPFLMEVTPRTEADRKGGHLARRTSDGQLILRESAQCPDEDKDAFQNIGKHRYFNTNNLWIRLDALKEALEASGGLLPLPMIKNGKTADPRDPSSPAVFQLESAMGAAIECFQKAAAIAVPRTRFAPVKETSDLLALRSDVFVETADYRVALHESRQGNPPTIHLDPAHHKLVEGLDRLTQNGVPSLVNCSSLRVEGDYVFETGAVLEGDVTLKA